MRLRVEHMCSYIIRESKEEESELIVEKIVEYNLSKVPII